VAVVSGRPSSPPEWREASPRGNERPRAWMPAESWQDAVLAERSRGVWPTWGCHAVLRRRPGRPNPAAQRSLCRCALSGLSVSAGYSAQRGRLTQQPAASDVAARGRYSGRLGCVRKKGRVLPTTAMLRGPRFGGCGGRARRRGEVVREHRQRRRRTVCRPPQGRRGERSRPPRA